MKQKGSYTLNAEALKPVLRQFGFLFFSLTGPGQHYI